MNNHGVPAALRTDQSALRLRVLVSADQTRIGGQVRSVSLFLAAALTIMTLVVIPGIVGTLFNKVCVSLVVVIELVLINYVKHLTMRNASVLVLLFGLLAYFGVQVAFLGDLADGSGSNIASTFTLAILGALGGAMATQVLGGRAMLRIWVGFMAVLAASAIVTTVVGIVVGFRTLLLLQFTIRDALANSGEADGYSIYFPFTVCLSSVHWMGFDLPRAAGGFREPGINQMYMVTALASTFFIQLRQRTLIQILLAGGVISSYSTVGVPLLIGVLAYRGIIVARNGLSRILVPMLLLGAAGGALYWEPLQVDYKINMAYDTKASRVSAVRDSFVALSASPLVGTGAFSQTSLPRGNDGISFLSGVHKLGYCGILLYLALVIAGSCAHYNSHSFLILLPCLTTVLFAQPLYLAASAMFLLNSDLRSLRILIGNRHASRHI